MMGKERDDDLDVATRSPVHLSILTVLEMFTSTIW